MIFFFSFFLGNVESFRFFYFSLNYIVIEPLKVLLFGAENKKFHTHFQCFGMSCAQLKRAMSRGDKRLVEFEIIIIKKKVLTMDLKLI